MGNSKPTAKLLSRLSRFWPVIGLVLLLFLFGFPYFVKGRIPFPADYLVNAFPPWQYYYGHPVKNSAMPDVVGQILPYRHLTISWWKEHIIPLWNPFMFSGTPFIANYQSAAFHPLNWLFFLLPEIEAWSIMILLQPLLAGLFTYWYCRQLKLSRPASFLSATAFMFCGFIVTWLAYGTMAWALLWLPLLFYLMEKAKGKATIWPKAFLSLAMAASFFSGHFQISVYVFLAALAYLVFNFLTEKKGNEFLVSLFFLGLGVLIAAPQILPSLELHNLASRSQVWGISEIIPWNYWPTLFAPDFFGNDVTRNAWYGHYAEWSSFTGVIPLLLTIYYFFKPKEKKSWFFILLLMASFFLARPTFLDPLIFKARIPVFSSSAASRINCLFSFALAVLAGFGLESLISDLKNKRFKPGFILAFFSLAVVVGLYAWLEFIKPYSWENLIVARRNLVLPSLIMAFFLGLMFAFWLLNRWLKLKEKRFSFVLSLVIFSLLVVNAFDLFRFAFKWVPFDSRQNYYPLVPILQYLPSKAGYERVFGYIGMEMQNYFRIPNFNGYDPLYPQRYGELLMAANRDDGLIQLPPTRGVGLERRAKYTIPLMNLMNGRYVLHAIKDGRQDWTFDFWNYPQQFRLIYADEAYEVYENQKALPRAFLAFDYELITNPQSIVNRLLAPDFKMNQTLILEQDNEVLTQIKAPDLKAQTEISLYEPNQVKIETHSQAPGLLFLADNYFPGWVALVDKKETPIYRADYTFRAIFVPEGDHQIEFIYQPRPFWRGVYLSCAGLSLIFCLVILNLRKKQAK